MPSRGTGSADDRRRTPRAACRLHGLLTRGKERIRIRIVDVSEGGLCLLSPVALTPKQPVQIAIDVPGRGPAKVQVEIWHVRQQKSRSSANKIWTAGAILRQGDPAYERLLAAAGAAPRAMTSESLAIGRGVSPSVPTTRNPGDTHPGLAPKPEAPGSAATAGDSAALDAVEPQVFRLRCKAKGGPRTRILSLAAESREEALKLASQALGAEWDVLEALEA